MTEWSSDLARIKALPIRKGFNETSIVDWMTKRFLLPQARNPDAKLLPVQAQALYELMNKQGLLAPIKVGGGKTLISLLAPKVLESKRPILLLPAALVEKTERERNIYGLDWNISRNLNIISYEALSRVDGANILDKADLIIADEVHAVKAMKSARTRRVVRLFENNPYIKFVALSGTIMRSSIKDFAHISEWCFRKGSPLPLEVGTTNQWAEILDDNPNGAFTNAADSSVLLELWPGAKSPREAFKQRFNNTEGVVSVGEGDGLDVGLRVSALQYKVSTTTQGHYKTLRETACTPDGWALADGKDVKRHAKELSLGFHSVWNPRPPEDWLAARKEWAAWCRETIEGSTFLDSEKAVKLWVRESENAMGTALLNKWEAAKPKFEINAEPIWHDRSALDTVQAWATKHRKGGIIWCNHRFFGAELSKLLKVPYFIEGGKAPDGTFIEDASGLVIASIKANGTGRNLQKWHANLIVSPMSKGLDYEQLLGRTHRRHQKADEVTCDILLGCTEHYNSVLDSYRSSVVEKELTGHNQKLLISDFLWPETRPKGGWEYE